MDLRVADPVRDEGRFPKSMFLKDGILLRPFVNDHPEAAKTLRYLFVRLYDSGLIRRVFNKDIKPEWFVEFFLNKNNLMIYFLDLEKQDLIGFAWLSDIIPGRAAAHFCFFREAWGEVSLRCGQMGMRYWLDGLRVDLLYGIVHSDNPRAIGYVKRLGWKEHGRIPGWGGRTNGKKVDGILVAYEREV